MPEPTQSAESVRDDCPTCGRWLSLDCAVCGHVGEPNHEGLWALADRKNRMAVKLAEAIRTYLGPTYHPEGCGSVLCDALTAFDAEPIDGDVCS